MRDAFVLNAADIPEDFIEAMAMRAGLRVGLAIADACIATGGPNVGAWREQRVEIERDLLMFRLTRGDLPD
jgi:hypothetical protein